MNKVYREDLDIEIAFSSSAKNLMSEPVEPMNEKPQDTSIPPNNQNHPKSPGHDSISIYDRIRKVFRAIARFGYYSIFKPIVSPFAFRFRLYLAEELLPEMSQEIQQASSLTVKEVQEAIESLGQDISNMHAKSLQEMEKAFSSTIHYIQESIESLKQDMSNMHSQSVQETKQSSSSISKGLKESIESLKQDMSNMHSQSVQVAKQSSSSISKGLKESIESLRQNISNIHTQSLHDVQQVSASALEEIEGYVTNLMPHLNRIEQYSFITARRVAINCGAEEILMRTEAGYVLCPAADHPVLASLIETGDLELGTRLLIQRFLRPGDVFVDVGANLGLHTLAAARAMNGQGRIIAFEPFELTKRLLEKNVWINGYSGIAEIHQTAVSNVSGHRKLFLGATIGHHSLFPLGPATNGQFAESVEVPVVRLDEIIGTGERVDLIKIDAEGAEIEVLEGGTLVVRNNPNIALIVEFGPSHLKRTGYTTRQWHEEFKKHHLLFRSIHPETGALEDWPLEQLERMESVNLFFARKDSPAWERIQT